MNALFVGRAFFPQHAIDADGNSFFLYESRLYKFRVELVTNFFVRGFADQDGPQIFFRQILKARGNVKLRFVLIEDVVRYPGGNGQRLHHHVVRALPGGAEGFAVKEANVKHKASVNVAELKKSLAEYLLESQKKSKFLDDEHPLGLKHLKVVAILQNDDNKEIIQAVQIDVDGKSGGE